MITFAKRRWLSVGITAIVLLLLLLVYSVCKIALLPTDFYSGWAMFLMILALTLFNIRKRLTPLPVGSAAAWLQFHIYFGLLSGLVFVLHIGFRVPNGGLEIALTLLYLFVVATGVVGLAVSRFLPSRLTRRGEEVLFERIPQVRNQLRDRAEELALKSASQGSTSTIADFYRRRLAHFFAGPRHSWSHLVASEGPCHALLTEFRTLDRYLSESERAIFEELAMLIGKKDDLDYQYAGQAALKYWLFAHIPATYSLLIFSVVHVIVVYAFSRGMR